MNSNTPQGTGAMTLEQGVAHVKAKLAERGATTADQAIVHPDSDEEDDPAFASHVSGAGEYHDSALDENADGVSGDESETFEQEPTAAHDDSPIILPDGQRITVAEARKGYLRQADFTRKTQDLARERERLTQREQASVQELGDLHQHLASLEDMEPDWQDLARRIPPAEFQQVQGYWQNRAALNAGAKQAAARAESRALAVQRQRMWDTLAAGTFEPAWKNPAALKSSMATLSDYLIDRGLPEDLVSSIYLPAAVEIAEESRRYRELQKAKPRAALAVQGKPQPFKPGSKLSGSPQSENIRLLSEAFRKNPSVDNAVALERARSWKRR